MLIPDYTQIFTCPQCGMKKEILRYVSQNTNVQTIWSDNKAIGPMRPVVSFVQKCPCCGHYYLLSRQKPERGNKGSFEQGELNYEEMKDAWIQLKDMPDMTENEKLSILIMQVWAFNDEYTRYQCKTIPIEEQTYIKEIIDLLLNMDMVDDLLRAELLREAGRFKESLEVLDDYSINNPYINQCKEYSSASNMRPFIIFRGRNVRNNMM